MTFSATSCSFARESQLADIRAYSNKHPFPKF